MAQDDAVVTDRDWCLHKAYPALIRRQRLPAGSVLWSQLAAGNVSHIIYPPKKKTASIPAVPPKAQWGPLSSVNDLHLPKAAWGSPFDGATVLTSSTYHLLRHCSFPTHTLCTNVPVYPVCSRHRYRSMLRIPNRVACPPPFYHPNSNAIGSCVSPEKEPAWSSVQVPRECCCSRGEVPILSSLLIQHSHFQCLVYQDTLLHVCSPTTLIMSQLLRQIPASNCDLRVLARDVKFMRLQGFQSCYSVPSSPGSTRKYGVLVGRKQESGSP